jgi:precorrin-2/cobalt-factor-2 C20-methyltransferase
MTQDSIGKIYAIGVGTGDSELLTLKAARILQMVDVIAIPEKNKGMADSFAWSIVTGALTESEMSGERCYLHFPMTRNAAVNVPAWKTAAQTLWQYLRSGKSVAFITEGDPSVYSTWAYVQEELIRLSRQLRIEVIPGITSITAIPAATQIPLADGQERFCVVPATYGIECLDRLVEEFDTIMLIKVGRVVTRLRKKLQSLGLESCATYVSHATCPQQEVYQRLEDVPDEHRYFAMVQLSIRGRKGVLRGTLPDQQNLLLNQKQGHIS